VCHLAGFISKENVVSYILDSLEVQEPIIGGQATGLAVLTGKKVKMVKDIGPVKDFKEKFKEQLVAAQIGIGHTRYTIKNLTSAKTNTSAKAHPFWDSKKKFVTMHNGTLLNYLQFANDLEKKGYQFRSKSIIQNGQKEEIVDYCDSEIFSFLLEEELAAGLEIKPAIKKICSQLEGQFAFVVLHPQYPETIFIANMMQPLFVGTNKESSFFSSFQEGFKPVEQLLDKKFTPPKNVLLTLSPGKVTIETLLKERSPPSFEPEPAMVKALVLKAVKEKKNDIANIWLFFKNALKDLGLTDSQFEDLEKKGFTFSPIIYRALQHLEQEGVLYRKRELVWEGGIDHTPRYRFYLNE